MADAEEVVGPTAQVGVGLRMSDDPGQVVHRSAEMPDLLVGMAAVEQQLRGVAIS